ncbi:MAG TPA: hypothetical protein VFC79_10650, partial [Tissierellaceae bacterium]|nr:hypothetical protein [Tissierellaceae bacterium]
AVYSLSEQRIVHYDHINVQHIRKLKKYRGLNINAIKVSLQREFFEDIKRKFPPKIVVIESGFAKFKKEVASLNQINGVVFSVFWNYSQVMYTPNAIKAEIVHGSADKQVVRDTLIDNIPELKGDELVFNNDNVSDAIAVLYTYLLKNKIRPKSTWDKGEYPKSVPKKKKIVKRKQLY